MKENKTIIQSPPQTCNLTLAFIFSTKFYFNIKLTKYKKKKHQKHFGGWEIIPIISGVNSTKHTGKNFTFLKCEIINQTFFDSQKSFGNFNGFSNSTFFLLNFAQYSHVTDIAMVYECVFYVSCIYFDTTHTCHWRYF